MNYNSLKNNSDKIKPQNPITKPLLYKKLFKNTFQCEIPSSTFRKTKRFIPVFQRHQIHIIPLYIHPKSPTQRCPQQNSDRRKRYPNKPISRQRTIATSFHTPKAAYFHSKHN